MDGSNSSTLGQTLAQGPRPAYWAIQVTKALLDCEAALTIGEKAVLLVIAIAATEDKVRYAKPVTFHNEPLARKIGLKKWRSLNRARQAAIDAGWLEYIAPPNGSSSPGSYRTLIPDDFVFPQEPYASKGHGQEQPSPPPYASKGHGGGYGGGQPSYLLPEPTNLLTKKAAAAEEISSEEEFRFTLKGGDFWKLPDGKLAEYQKTFSGIDAAQALRKAAQWCKDNPAKRKTARGMPAFLNRWLSNQKPPTPPQEKPPELTDEQKTFFEQDLEWLGEALDMNSRDPKLRELAHKSATDPTFHEAVGTLLDDLLRDERLRFQKGKLRGLLLSKIGPWHEATILEISEREKAKAEQQKAEDERIRKAAEAREQIVLKRISKFEEILPQIDTSDPGTRKLAELTLDSNDFARAAEEAFKKAVAEKPDDALAFLRKQIPIEQQAEKDRREAIARNARELSFPNLADLKSGQEVALPNGSLFRPDGSVKFPDGSEGRWKL